MNTGTWTPNLPKLQYYKIKMHIPATGARSHGRRLHDQPGGGVSALEDPGQPGRGTPTQWVTIGTFAMENGGSVELSNKSRHDTRRLRRRIRRDRVRSRGRHPGHPDRRAARDPGCAKGGSNPACMECGCGASTAGDPVNTATGYFGDSYTDLTHPGPRHAALTSPALRLGSLPIPNGPDGALAVNGPFGYGWTFSYGLSAATDAAPAMSRSIKKTAHRSHSSTAAAPTLRRPRATTRR